MFDPAPPLPPTQPVTLAGTVQALRAKLVPFVDRVGGQIDVTRARLGDVFDKHRQVKQPLSQFLSHAYSVTNDTQIALNVSLNVSLPSGTSGSVQEPDDRGAWRRAEAANNDVAIISG